MQQGYAPQPLQFQPGYDQGYAPAPQPSYDYQPGYSGAGGGHESGGQSGAFTPPAGAEEQADWSDRLYQQPKAAPVKSSGYAQMFREEQQKKKTALAAGARSGPGAVKAGRRASAKAKPRAPAADWDSSFTEGPGWMAEAGKFTRRRQQRKH